MASPRVGRRLGLIVWLFVGIVVALLALVAYSVNLLSSGRALVAAESAWSKSQKDAIFYLKRYALDRTDPDFHAFERAIAVPLAMRRARQELSKPQPDSSSVRADLVHAGSHPDDVDGMVSLALRLRRFANMHEANELWVRSDAVIDEIAALGRRIRAEDKDASEAGTRQALYEIDRLNERIVPHQNQFAEALGEALRAVKDLLLVGMLVFSAAILLIAVGVSRRFLRQSEAHQQMLRDNEAQLRSLIVTAALT